MVPAPTVDAWMLLLGPGDRTAGLLPALAAIVIDRLGPAAPAVRAVVDPLALLEVRTSHGRLLIDAGGIAPEDLGIVRRFLEARPGWELVVTGDEEGSRAARGLLALGRSSWRGWPLDVDQLDALAGPPLAAAVEIANPGPPALDPAPEPDAGGASEPVLGERELRELEEDLEAIEEILASSGVDAAAAVLESDDDEERDAPLSIGDHDPRDLDLTPEEIEAFFDPVEPAPAAVAAPAATARETSTVPATRASTWSPPTWYRDQVADLADRAQRLELAVSTLHEVGGSDALTQDVVQMTQFARTLGYLVAPPGPGEQEIVLDTLIEELLAGLAGARPDSPRFLFRPSADLARVRSDKHLLVACFDALLNLADACSSGEDQVRVSIERQGDEQAVLVRFPSGPIEDVPLDSILTPYALHRIVPRIGPNALAAAARILQGQGGDLAIGADEASGGRVLCATLPAV